MKLKHPEKFNIDLAERVVTHVIINPQRHYQVEEFDRCAQVGCLMGWAAVFSGKLDGDSSEDDLGLENEEWMYIFDEMSNRKAIEKMVDYIDQAKAVQQPVEEPVEHELFGV